MYNLAVSVPSRGFSSFLQKSKVEAETKKVFPSPREVGWVPTQHIQIYRFLVYQESFRPLARYGWGPTDKVLKLKKPLRVFPSPLEVWVGSYWVSIGISESVLRLSFRPLSRYGWAPTNENEETKNGKRKFPSPLEAWVVSYLTGILGNVPQSKCFRPLSRLG